MAIKKPGGVLVVAKEMDALKAPENSFEVNLYEELNHGVIVSNLSYDVAKEMGLDNEECYELAIAGMLHDIGKLKLTGYINGQEQQDPLAVEEMKYVRMHSALGYNELKGQGYSDFVLKSILYHHENYDGSGYPSSRAGEDIPIGARIIRVCDGFAELRSGNTYRKAVDTDGAMGLMIEEIRHFDLRVFLALQNVVHQAEYQNLTDFSHVLHR
jgi:HD-GYP domain-containing protein (c-di-GMP phosphodiesterase class II)